MKPKYRFFSNAKYALCGILAMLKNEVAFRIECLCVIPLFFIAFLLEIPLYERILLIAVLLLILMAECFNTAIESCVDLVTQEFDARAKVAKDCASAGVLFSVCLAILTWIVILANHYLAW